MEPEVNVDIQGVNMEGQDPPPRKSLRLVIPTFYKIQV